MKTVLLLAVIITLAPSSVRACSIERLMYRFEPDTVEFNHKHDFPIALTVPTPVVEITSFERATSTVVGNCRNYAVVTLHVSVPGSSFKITELGFLFRSEPGKPQSRFMAFPNFPVRSRTITGKKAVFRFFLEDPPVNRADPFSLTLDVSAVNDGLQFSDSTSVVVSGK